MRKVELSAHFKTRTEKTLSAENVGNALSCSPITVRIPGLGHCHVSRRVECDALENRYDRLYCGTPEHATSRLNALRPLRIIAHNDHWHPKRGGLFLDATRIRQNHVGGLHDPEQLAITHRRNNVNIRNALKAVNNRPPYVRVRVDWEDEIDVRIAGGENGNSIRD